MSKDRLVFISYSHKDRKWLELFLEHLNPLAERKLLSIWSDTDIQVGRDWRHDIEHALEHASAAVLLVSPSFLASDFVLKHELPQLLKAVRAHELRILWIPISHSLYQHTEIATYQAAHDPARPLDALSKAQRNKAVVRIAESILQLVQTIPIHDESTVAYDSPAAVAIRPILMIVYKKDGWYLENKGRGPALDIIVAQKHVVGRESGSWFNPVRVPTLGPKEEQHLAWLGHENDTGLGASYRDEDGRPFTSVTGNDLTTVHRARLLPNFEEHEIARHWEFFGNTK